MPGRASDSGPLAVVGVAVAVGAVVGTTVFGWEFGGSDPTPILLGVLAGVVAVAVTAYRRDG